MRADTVRQLSSDDLILLLTTVHEEMRRRHMGAEVIEVHRGNAGADRKPLPLLIRVLKRIPTLPPSDLAKVDTLLEGWVRTREQGRGA